VIEGLGPYPEYKDSGYAWVGSVPSHWDLLPNRALFSGIKERNHPTVERPLRLKGIDPNRACTPKEIKALKESAERADDAPPVIRKIHKKGTAPAPLRGRFAATIDGKPAVVEYEPDTDLRDTEQVPLLKEGGIEAFLRREVLPHAMDAWYDPEKGLLAKP